MIWNANEIARYGRELDGLAPRDQTQIEALNATFGTRQFGGGGSEKLTVGKVYEILPITRKVQTAKIENRTVTWPAVQTTEGINVSFGKLSGHRLQYDPKFLRGVLAEKVETFVGLASSEKELLACTKPRTRAACAMLAGYSLACKKAKTANYPTTPTKNRPFLCSVVCNNRGKARRIFANALLLAYVCESRRSRKRTCKVRCVVGIQQHGRKRKVRRG